MPAPYNHSLLFVLVVCPPRVPLLTPYSILQPILRLLFLATHFPDLQAVKVKKPAAKVCQDRFC